MVNVAVPRLRRLVGAAVTDTAGEEEGVAEGLGVAVGVGVGVTVGVGVGVADAENARYVYLFTSHEPFTFE